MKKLFPLAIVLTAMFSPLLWRGAGGEVHSQITPIWTNRYNGVGDFSDKINNIALDNSGNIYLCGYSMNSGNLRDFLTIKLNSNGDTLWVRTFDGAGGGIDEALAIAVDASGNVYSTGYQKGNNTGNDYLTIKYNSIGDTLWTRVYNHTTNLNDQSNSIALDASGNIYVTGQSDNGTQTIPNDDYATVKYNSSGVQQWAKRFNGTGNSTDRAVKVAVDAGSNVYVTGRSKNTVDDDYITIKYNSSGGQLWATAFDGGYADIPTAMTIDNSANIYVTGRSKNANANYDYLTVMYDNSGVEQWNAPYDGAGAGTDKATAVAVDGSGNVYVTGQSDMDTSIAISYDYVTVAYDNFGTYLWENNYNGTGGNDDIPNAIAIDANSNVYVTGQSDADPSSIVTNNNYATIKYNSSGTQAWVKTYNGSANLSDAANALAVNSSGDVFITGNSQNNITQKDGVTIKYNSAGIQQWQKTFNGLGDNSDNASAIAVDNSNNTYVAGYTFGNGTDRDFCVIKINSIGDTAWVRKFDGTSNSTDQAVAIAVDASGNVYATGFLKNSGSGNDIVTIKYGSGGNIVWIQQYNGTGNGTDKANALAIDVSGNVYVTGYSDNDTSALTNFDFITIKYNSLGTQQWAIPFEGDGYGNDKAVAIKVSSAGNVFITGESDGDLTANVNLNIVTLKYNSGGALQFTASYAGAYGNDSPADLVIDGSENSYVTGQSIASSNGVDNDFITVKYNAIFGAQQWMMTYNGTGNGDDQPNNIALDAAGNVFVTGKTDVDTSSTVTNYNYLTIKYDIAGNQQWTANYNGIANGNDNPSGIAIDDSSNIYVTGQCNNGTLLIPNNDYVTIKYSPAGAQQWAATYNGTGNASDGANAIAAKGNSIYLTGGSAGSTSQKDIVTMKYSVVAAYFTAAPTSVCEGQTITFTNQSINNPTSYAWIFPGGTPGTSTLQNPTVTYNTAGIYNVTLTVSNSYGSDTKTKTSYITVKAIPPATVTANGSTTFCAGGSVLLTATAAATYLWSNGMSTQSITVNSTGNYLVTVTGSNGCTAVSSSTTVTVNSLPSATITAGGPTTFCSGGSVLLTATAAATYLWSNSSTNQSITVNSSGSFTVTVTNSSGCSAASSPTTVTVTSTATAVITPNGSTTFCQGGSVVLSGNQGTGYNWSNGGTTQSITVTQSGTFTVTITNAGGCTGTAVSSPVTVTVNPNPTPTITASGATTFCAGDSVTLTSSAASAYSWTGGATTQSISATSSGNYFVTVTDGNGCTGVSPPKTVTVNPNPTPTITAGGTTTFCAGDSVILTSSAASAYSWTGGATTQSITVTTSGNYFVTVTDGNGCSGASSPETITVDSLPTTPVITESGDTLTSSAAANYQWYFNGNIISGATSQTYIATATGKYTVVVTNNCGSVTSNQLTVTISGIENLFADFNFEIFPNPATDKFFIRGNFSLPTTIELFDLTGKTLFSKPITDYRLPITVSFLSNGIYFVKLIAGDKMIVKRMVELK